MTKHADLDKLNFLGTEPIDKVVDTNTSVQVTNDGNTGSSPQSAKIVTASVPNPYGLKCFARFEWTIDDANYSNPDAHLVYTYDYTVTFVPFTTKLGGLAAAVSVGVNKSEVLFRTANGYHGNVGDDGVNITYTPNPLTFKIKYALFEIL